MKKTISIISQFSLRLLIGLVIVFAIHATSDHFLGISIFNHLLIPAYLTNYALVVFTFVIIIWLKNQKSQSLGFVYIAGFFVKLAVFFIFFNPYYKSDDIIQNVEFVAFFVPYAFCLTYETIVLVKILNRD